MFLGSGCVRSGLLCAKSVACAYKSRNLSAIEHGYDVAGLWPLARPSPLGPRRSPLHRPLPQPSGSPDARRSAGQPQLRMDRVVRPLAKCHTGRELSWMASMTLQKASMKTAASSLVVDSGGSNLSTSM